MEKGSLYLVPTPIGNLKDMTFRAVEVLNSVFRIYAEDTRTSKHLLTHYNISTPCHSYHKFNEKQRIKEVTSLLESGFSVAIISDAGTPGISDPSNIIVKECIHTGLNVIPLPGATALIPAVTASGFDSERFIMLGFLPSKKSESEQVLRKNMQAEMPLILYESPHRLIETLIFIKEILGDRDICIARELSKQFESWYRNRISFFIDNPDEIKIKGEFVLIINRPSKIEITDEDIIQEIRKHSADLSKKEVSALVSETLGISKKTVYNLLINKGREV
ncbi:MAG: 16S rRNA (cytidine(1402)-2'-O)-methyltransferase [Candidatus Cloacimonetes bacterium]|nr:16S rRNA (cytidine(1402)-2'-O)-methyltransferase [Candidatus Cloacimonadota bacterium]